MAITFWRNVQRKITTQEMDASFDTLVNDIANAGLSDEMPEGTIYIGDNTNVASLETLDTSIVPSVLDKRYVTDANLTVIGNTSGTNTGDNATNTTSNAYADGKVADAINDGVTTIAPSQNAVFDALALKSNIASPTFTGTVTTPDINISGATASTPTFFDATKKLITTTAQLWGTWVQTWSNKATPVDADTIGFHDSASTFAGVKSTLLNFWTVYLLPKVQVLGYLTGSGLTANYNTKYNGTSLVNSMIYDNGTVVNIGGTTGTGKMSIMNIANSSVDGTKGYKIENLAGTTVMLECGVSSDSYVGTISASAFNIRTSNVARLLFSGSGDLNINNIFYQNSSKIGVGTSSLTGLLTIAGANSATNGTNGLRLDLSATGTQLAFEVGNSNDSFIGSISASKFSLRTSNIARLTVDTSGNVGIGTTSPNASAIIQADSTTKGNLSNPRMTTAQKNAVTKVEGLVVYDTDLDTLCQTNGTVWTSIGSSNLVLVSSKGEFPSPVAGVITLLANTTYFINGTIDLTGDRLVCSANTTIIGGSSENCRIKSTGLVSALITSVYSLPLRNITLEASLALNLDGDGTTTALDWFGVNFTDCAVIGTVKDHTNFIMSDCAFLNSGGMTIDGTFGSVGFSTCLFDCNTTNTAFILPSTLTISRRFRIIYSSFVVLSGETGININASATIPTESYILDTVNFGGGGTYLTGITHTSNDALFSSCVGITNTAVNGQLYMQANATATTVSATNTFYKIAGTTTASADNSKFTHSNNRLTCDAVISRKYLIQAHLSFTSGNSNVCEFGFYDSVLATVRTPSKTKSTANSGGRAENISFACVVTMGLNDYIEIHGANTSAINNITVDQLNFIITEIK